MSKFILYQMLPRVFGQREWVPGGTYESNGSGKMNDITEDVLAGLRDELHVGAVWYTGIIEHATKTHFPGIAPCHPDLVKGQAGSPYAITNYFDVAPELATGAHPITTESRPKKTDTKAIAVGQGAASLSSQNRMQEFEALVARTHAAGLKVVMDYVPNHVFRQYQKPFSSVNFYTLYGQTLHLPSRRVTGRVRR